MEIGPLCTGSPSRLNFAFECPSCAETSNYLIAFRYLVLDGMYRAGEGSPKQRVGLLDSPFLHLFPGGVGQQVLELVDLLVLVANSVSRLVILASIAVVARSFHDAAFRL